jgi:hypothetical protein
LNGKGILAPPIPSGIFASKQALKGWIDCCENWDSPVTAIELAVYFVIMFRNQYYISENGWPIMGKMWLSNIKSFVNHHASLFVISDMNTPGYISIFAKADWMDKCIQLNFSFDAFQECTWIGFKIPCV